MNDLNMIFGSMDTEWNPILNKKNEVLQNLSAVMMDLHAVALKLHQNNDIDRFRHLKKLVAERLEEIAADVERLGEYVDID